MSVRIRFSQGVFVCYRDKVLYHADEVIRYVMTKSKETKSIELVQFDSKDAICGIFSKDNVNSFPELKKINLSFCSLECVFYIPSNTEELYMDKYYRGIIPNLDFCMRSLKVLHINCRQKINNIVLPSLHTLVIAFDCDGDKFIWPNESNLPSLRCLKITIRACRGVIPEESLVNYICTRRSLRRFVLDDYIRYAKAALLTTIAEKASHIIYIDRCFDPIPHSVEKLLSANRRSAERATQSAIYILRLANTFLKNHKDILNYLARNFVFTYRCI